MKGEPKSFRAVDLKYFGILRFENKLHLNHLRTFLTMPPLLLVLLATLLKQASFLANLLYPGVERLVKMLVLRCCIHFSKTRYEIEGCQSPEMAKKQL